MTKKVKDRFNPMFGGSSPHSCAGGEGGRLGDWMGTWIGAFRREAAGFWLQSNGAVDIILMSLGLVLADLKGGRKPCGPSSRLP